MSSTEPSPRPQVAPRSPVNRRQFAKRLTAGAVVGALATSSAISTTKAIVEEVEGSPPMDDLWATIVKQIEQDYGVTLDDESRAKIRADLESQAQRSAVLSAFPLSNGDEPAPVYSAYRGDPRA